MYIDKNGNDTEGWMPARNLKISVQLALLTKWTAHKFFI